MTGFRETRTGFPSPTPWVKLLLIYYASAFALELALSLVSESTLQSVLGSIAIVPRLVWENPLHLYRVGTFLLLPEFQIWTIIINLLSIYFVGGLLEDSMGSKRLLGVFALSGAFAGGGYCLIAGSEGSLPLLGVSASCLGLLACAATLYPRLQVIFLFFPLPLWAVAAIIAAIHLFAVLRGSSLIALSYLLGLAGGGLYAWNLKAVVPLSQRIGVRRIAESWRRRREGRKRDREARERAEMDRILEKINRTGIGSLTSSEKRSLDRASRRLRKTP